MDKIDIVLATCDRLKLLRRTLKSIWHNTRTPYRLHVIDDASTEGNQVYLRRLLAMKKIDSLLEHPNRLGVAANLRQIHDLTVSDLVIYCDDDQLCPHIEPDWLRRLLAEMQARPKQAILSLNNPHGNMGGDKRRKLGVDGNVTFCRKSGGSYMCIRRELLPHIVPPDGIQSPVSWMCLRARKLGWQTGYLTHTYCQHIGTHSLRWKNKDLSEEIALLKPVDSNTLEPPKEYRE